MRQLVFYFVALCTATTNAYAPGGVRVSQRKSVEPRAVGVWLSESLQHDSSEFEVVLTRVRDVYPKANIAAIELKEHKPLGCTVEESLDTDNDPSVVFVSKLVIDGNAEKAGVKVGDVLVGVTGLFGEMTPVWQSGVEKM